MKNKEIYAKVTDGDFMKNRFKGILSLLLATVIWGSAFIAQSTGMDYIGPFTFQAIRCMLAVLFLIPTVLIYDFAKKDSKNTLKHWLDPKLWKTGLICGGALFIAASLQQVGMVYTDAGKAGFITAMYIVLVPVIGFLFKNKPPKSAIISVVIAIAGLYLLCCVDATRINIGDLLVLGCAFAFAVQITLIDRFAAELDGLRLNCIQSLVVAILSVPFVFITETVDVGNIMQCWLPLCFAGILSMGVAYSLQIIGQKHLEPTPAALIMSLESVFAALGGWLILKETMTGSELTGCIMVFVAVVISQIPIKKK